MSVFSGVILAACVVVSLLASSCATPYRALEDHYGYSEQQVGKDRYEVTFMGNGNTSYERAFDFALLRAADIALAREAKSFIVSDAVNLSSVRVYQSPTRYYQTASPYLSTGGRTAPSAPEFINGTERRYTMAAPAEERIFYRPGVKLRILLLLDPPGGFYPYDPAKVRQQLKQKYRITVEKQ